MDKRKSFLKGVLVLALVFAAFLTGCSNETVLPIAYPIIPPNVGAPAVKARTINTGVQLYWPAVIDTTGYEIWRSGGGQDSPIQLNASYGTWNDGVIYYNDTVNYSSTSLKENTDYVYTVVAIPVSGVKDTGKAEVKIKSGTFLPAGTKAPQPANVELAIDYGVPSVSITITPPTNTVPHEYIATFNVGGVSPVNTHIYSDGSNARTKTLYLDDLGITELGDMARKMFNLTFTGDISVYVVGYLGDSTSAYYEPSDAYTYKKTVAPLFGNLMASISFEQKHYYRTTGSNAIAGFGVALNLTRIAQQPGVTYTIERAKQTNNPNGNLDWSPITLYRSTSRTSDTVDLTANTDIFGNLDSVGIYPGYTSSYGRFVYDNYLPVEEGTWTYRVKGVRDGITDYTITNPMFTINFWDNLLSLAWGEFKINIMEEGTGPFNDGTARYEFKPSLDRDFQNMIQPGEKLVIYWVRGGTYSDYYGQFSTDNSISFSKEELSGATINSKQISIPRASGSYTSLFVQAYLESPNKERRAIPYTNWAEEPSDYYPYIIYDWNLNENGQYTYTFNYW